MTFIICLAIVLNLISLHANLKDQRYGWSLLSVGAIGACLVALTSCTTAVQSNSSHVNRSVEMRKR